MVGAIILPWTRIDLNWNRWSRKIISRPSQRSKFRLPTTGTLRLSKITYIGSGCGSVGRAVASDTRGPRFESSHQQKFIYTLNICLLSTEYWKDENKEKEAGIAQFFLKSLFTQNTYGTLQDRLDN